MSGGLCSTISIICLFRGSQEDNCGWLDSTDGKQICLPKERKQGDSSQIGVERVALAKILRNHNRVEPDRAIIADEKNEKGISCLHFSPRSAYYLRNCLR